MSTMSSKALDRLNCWRYSYPAPHKTGAGRGNPILLEATPDAASVFFVVRYTRHSMAWCAHLMAGCSQAPDHATAHRAALIMVTLAGLPKGRPVPSNAGISTPVNVTALFERGNSSGDSLNLLEEAVTMATTLTPSHPLFVWRFYSGQNLTYLTTTATSEREARLQLPAVRLVFVARIRLEAMNHA
ncbi:host cell division inhibitor Icd-like protein [Salmonella enterica]|nr:Ash-like/host cell division inhibitor Icd-like protein [Salmonella enterica]EAU9424905.1 host cell division inhibitor Icd-like protein [Salmonella enterica]EBQ2127718.1 host cell division inhibitor Icd-like protein [Salmonella enterica]